MFAYRAVCFVGCYLARLGGAPRTFLAALAAKRLRRRFVSDFAHGGEKFRIRFRADGKRFAVRFHGVNQEGLHRRAEVGHGATRRGLRESGGDPPGQPIEESHSRGLSHFWL